MMDGQLLSARGFRWADQESRRPAQPDTLFRLASISNPLTALVIAHLIQDRKLACDQKVFPTLRYPTPIYFGAVLDLTGNDHPPATASQVARWMGGRSFPFDPGSRPAHPPPRLIAHPNLLPALPRAPTIYTSRQ